MTKQLTLKEQYLSRKKLEQTKRLVEAHKQLKEHFVLVEAIDENQLKAMADAIEKLEGLLSNIKGKVPTLSAAFDAATGDMEKFVTTMVSGKSTPAELLSYFAKNKLDNPMTKSMTLFTALSKFLKQDVPAVLKAFRADKNPEVPLKDIKFAGGDANATAVRDAFKKALRPGGILGFFGLKSIPYVGPNLDKIADELMNLTSAELTNLSQNSAAVKTPITATDAKQLVQTAAQGQNPFAPAGEQKPAAAPVAGPNAFVSAFDKVKAMPERDAAGLLVGAFKNATNAKQFIDNLTKGVAVGKSTAKAPPAKTKK